MAMGCFLVSYLVLEVCVVFSIFSLNGFHGFIVFENAADPARRDGWLS